MLHCLVLLQVYTKAFMVDWGLSNIALFIKNNVEQNKVKDMMMLVSCSAGKVSAMMRVFIRLFGW